MKPDALKAKKNILTLEIILMIVIEKKLLEHLRKKNCKNQTKENLVLKN